MWVNLLLMAVGFAALIWSADRFCRAAATATNRRFNILIGLTVVSLGTSAPEIVVALIAALEGNAILVVGNAIGSNIANIGLAWHYRHHCPAPFLNNVLRRELPWLLGATAIAIILMFDRELDWLDGLILLSGWPTFSGSYCGRKRIPIAEARWRTRRVAPDESGSAIFWLLSGLMYCSAQPNF